MSGKAFDLGEDAFPRMPTSAYASLEKSLSNQMRTLYRRIETPIIAPWRTGFASIYFIVSEPISENAQAARASLKTAIGAKHERISAPGSPISLFAVPLTDVSGKFLKVEVHECQSEAEINCARFYLSYSDFGMILSLMARVHGFIMGTKGLKVILFNSCNTIILIVTFRPIM